MNNRRIWFRLGGVLAAAAVCTGGAAVVSDRAPGSEKCTEGVPRRDGNADADRVLSVGDRLTNPEQGFSVELPVNRDTITATMKKENGVWKLDSIDSQISLSAAVPADDEVCRERYPTFETARQAADSIDD